MDAEGTDADRLQELVAEWTKYNDQLKLVEDELRRLGAPEHASCGGFVVGQGDASRCLRCDPPSA